MLKEKTIRFLATAGLWLAASFRLSGGTMPEGSTPLALEQNELIQVKAHLLSVDPASSQPVVFLADSLKERALPIQIGLLEANAIYSEIQGIKHRRPLYPKQ